MRPLEPSGVYDPTGFPEELDQEPPRARARPPRRRKRNSPWLAVALFVATFLSTLAAGARVPKSSFHEWSAALAAQPSLLLTGLPFAVTLMAILLAHEMGHYLTARRYGVDQSLPYFIPAPTLFGTLGALIMIRSQPANRRVLLNVAVNGPYAGLVLAVAAVTWGLAHSSGADMPLGDNATFGSSLLFSALHELIAPQADIATMHPVGVAGWVGLFVTSLNLIPAGQLDGGHVSYALFGRRHEIVSLAVVSALLGAGLLMAVAPLFGSGGERGSVWIFWALLLFVFGLRHPPVRDERLPLTSGQRLNAWVALAIFIVTFVPVPIETRARAEPSAEPPAQERTIDGLPAERFRL